MQLNNKCLQIVILIIAHLFFNSHTLLEVALTIKLINSKITLFLNKGYPKFYSKIK